MGSESRKRPWLAALLAAVVTGLGHVYLRRWLRAVGWLALVLLAVLLFVPEGAVWEASLSEIAPVGIIGGMSVIDAFLLARQYNQQPADAQQNHCPSCGREHTVDASFCWYCAAELPETTAANSEADGTEPATEETP